jgi:acetyl esterase/lipase
MDTRLDTRRMVAAELLGPLDQYQKFDLAVETLPATRAETDRRTAALYSPREGIVTEERAVPGPPDAPAVRVLVSRRADSARAGRPAVLWIHGGGYVLGTADRSRPVLDMLCAELDCVAVSVEYRLAPETPHPGALEDCYAALAWLHADAGELGIDAGRIAIGGESAGGGLAAALAALARDRGELPVRLQALVYPMLDDRTVSTVEPHPFAGEFVWTAASNAFGWHSMLGGRSPGDDGVSPYAAPARQADLAGLPPAVIVVGALDLFVDEDIEYGRRLLRAGVPTELHLYPGAFHGFFSFEATDLGRRVRGDVTDALRRAFAADRS